MTSGGSPVGANGPDRLFDESACVLTRATCAWAGVKVEEADAADRAQDFIAMVDAFGAAGPRLWRGKLARMRTQKWIISMVNRVRAGELQVSHDTALHHWAYIAP